MAGISSKAALGLENKYKYNGIELDTSLGLDEYEAHLRDLDPQTGRWWQVDPETEDQEMWSPYTSNYDNPILYQDPRGNEGEACCQWLKDIATTALATTSVAVDNVLGTNVTERIANSGAIPSSETATWNNAVTTSNQTFLVAGTGASIIGGAAANDAAATTVASGGLLSEGTLPVVLIGTGTAVVGALVATNASRNLAQGNGLIKETGSYTNTHESGTKYHGKGDAERAAQSGKEKAAKYNDPLVKTDHTKAKNDREAFKQESKRLENDGGHKSSTNYNKRDSPGIKYRKQDGE